MTEQKRILVIDDDADILEQLSLILSKDGYQVVCAQGQEQGEEVLLTERPDLVISDVMMDTPDSGFVICHQVRKLYPTTPIIVLTAVTASTGLDFAPRTATERCFVQADELLHKPVHPNKLRQAVQRLLARAEGEARSHAGPHTSH